MVSARRTGPAGPVSPASRVRCRAGRSTWRLPTTPSAQPSFRCLASLAVLGRRPGIVARVLAPVHQAPVVVAPLVVEERAAARTAALLGEEGLELRDGVDLAAAGATGESRHVRSGGSEARAASTFSSGYS